MKGLQATLFVLAIICLSAQTIHFSYKKYLRNTDSVLDSEADRRIKKAKSLQELKKEYDALQAEIRVLEKNKPPVELRRMYNKHPYSTRNKISYTIRTWERSAQELTKMLFHWTAGLFLFLVGALLYWRRLPWQGMAFITAGMLEMIWWSSPALSARGAYAGYIDTLNMKLILTLVTLSIVLFAWNMRKKVA